MGRPPKNAKIGHFDQKFKKFLLTKKNKFLPPWHGKKKIIKIFKIFKSAYLASQVHTFEK